jgi:hypothetical protein
MNCPKCSGRMEDGFLLDRSHGALTQNTWVEGAPAPSFWTGLKVKGLTQLPVTTQRCTSCGYLESYAREAPRD